MGLFNEGKFTLHSGEISDFKIDCDFLTDEDIKTLAGLIAKRIGYFTAVEGVPTGGTRLALALEKSVVHDHHADRLLIVDDVLTSGGSMEQHRAGREATGVVLFARGECPRWVFPVFTLGEGF